jgi:lysophospholipase L1-like esterase
MIDCMVIGDSIAVGTAMYRPECVSYSRGGWNSWQWNKDYLSHSTTKSYDTIIISLGANDHKGVKTEYELRKMREAIKGKRVFWILPANNENAQHIIYLIASDYRDGVLGIQKLSSDGIHPTSKEYKRMAEMTK